MNALVTVEQAPTAGSHGEGHTVFSPRRQAEFLQNLQLFGNVRLACRAARVSAQTAYRQRRASAALAQAWDAALLAARAHAEATLADRAINGVEEPVFYHGEEIARRRRYSDRLLLAHLARLDRLEDRAEVVEALGCLDAQIDALRAGEALPELTPEPEPETGPHENPQDRVPSVPPCREYPPSSTNGVGRTEYPACESCGGQCDNPEATLTEADCQWFGNRLERFYDARPKDAPRFADLADRERDAGDVEAAQMAAFEAGEEEWWLVTGKPEDGEE